jgi:hypothetical protein
VVCLRGNTTRCKTCSIHLGFLSQAPRASFRLSFQVFDFSRVHGFRPQPQSELRQFSRSSGQFELVAWTVLMRHALLHTARRRSGERQPQARRLEALGLRGGRGLSTRKWSFPFVRPNTLVEAKAGRDGPRQNTRGRNRQFGSSSPSDKNGLGSAMQMLLLSLAAFLRLGLIIIPGWPVYSRLCLKRQISPH